MLEIFDNFKKEINSKPIFNFWDYLTNRKFEVETKVIFDEDYHSQPSKLIFVKINNNKNIESKTKIKCW